MFQYAFLYTTAKPNNRSAADVAARYKALWHTFANLTIQRGTPPETAKKWREGGYGTYIRKIERLPASIHMKTLLGNSPGGQNEMLGLANAFTGGDMDILVNHTNACFVAVSEDLPKLRVTHPIFDIKDPLPAKFTIIVSDTKLALDKIKVNKATGPERITPWALKEFPHLLAAPVTAIFNSSLREGVLPKL